MVKIELIKRSLLCLLFFISIASYAQVKCPFDQVDCPGICGMFTDNNNDGFCDYGELSEKNKPKPDTIDVEVQQATNRKTPLSDTLSAVEKSSKRKTEVSAENDAAIDEPVAETSTLAMEPVKSKKMPYRLFTISISLLVLYFISLTLVQLKKLKKVTHRKIWNIGLTVSFLFSGISGFMLVFFINYSYLPSFYRSLMRIHVEFGIAMAIISVFHLFWHLTYYKNIFKRPKHN